MCEHHWQVLSAEPQDRVGRRMVTFACSLCNEQITKLTARSTREIEAELAEQ